MALPDCPTPGTIEQPTPRKRATRSRTSKKSAAEPAATIPDQTAGSTDAEPAVFDPEIIAKMRELAASGLNPESVLRLLARLMAEVPAATKEIMDRIKMIDSLIKTSRSMMETKLKLDDVAALMSRLDELEAHLERLEPAGSLRSDSTGDLWTRPDA
ncbi:MAG: hypothetical protein LDL33_11805 [Desulfomonile sp.]|nr:hypothetical protein [Desulfomonile sp.]